MMYVLKNIRKAKSEVMSLSEGVLDKLDKRKCTAAVGRNYGVNQSM
jgi:hypothetical protein